jgi:hypothetical protein
VDPVDPAVDVVAVLPRWLADRSTTDPARTTALADAAAGRPATVPVFTIDSLVEGGARLCPSGLAASTPQTFPAASRSPASRLPQSPPPPMRWRVRAAPGPDPPGSSR